MATITFKSLEEALTIANQPRPKPKIYIINGKEFYSKEYEQLEDRKIAALHYVLNNINKKCNGKVINNFKDEEIWQY